MERLDFQRTDGALGAVRINNIPEIIVIGRNAPVLARSVKVCDQIGLSQQKHKLLTVCSAANTAADLNPQPEPKRPRTAPKVWEPDLLPVYSNPGGRGYERCQGLPTPVAAPVTAEPAPVYLFFCFCFSIRSYLIINLVLA